MEKKLHFKQDKGFYAPDEADGPQTLTGELMLQALLYLKEHAPERLEHELKLSIDGKGEVLFDLHHITPSEDDDKKGILWLGGA